MPLAATEIENAVLPVARESDETIEHELRAKVHKLIALKLLRWPLIHRSTLSARALTTKDRLLKSRRGIGGVQRKAGRRRCVSLRYL